MGLFSNPAKHSYLGIDIGTSGIKLVELNIKKGRPCLMTYGYTEYESGTAISSPLEHTEGTAKLLSKLVKETGAVSKKAMAALPASSVFSAIITVPRRKEQKEVAALALAEAAKLTPLPIQEMVTYTTFLDPIVLEKNQAATPYIRVLVTGASKSIVEKYVEIFGKSGITLQAIDTENFALIRALVGKDLGSVVIIDFGFSRTSITVVERGIPLLARSFNVGGQSLTRRIMEQLKVDEASAEQWKRDLSDAPDGGIPPFIEPVFQPIVHEIRYSLELLRGLEAAKQKIPDKIILTGGSSQVQPLASYLSKTVNMNVYLGDPWARVAYPSELQPVLDEIGPKMSVAVGLAMREDA